MAAFHDIPQELRDEISSYIASPSILNASAFNFAPGATSEAYDQVWNAIFKNNEWHECEEAKHANIVLIRADLDILSNAKKSSARAHIMLTIYNRRGDLGDKHKLLDSSLRAIKSGPEEYKGERHTLTLGDFSVPKLQGKDFRYFLEKKIRTLKSQDIRGINRLITNTKDLNPIFLLNLQPPVQTSLDKRRAN
jgi:hypothetical protein